MKKNRGEERRKEGKREKERKKERKTYQAMSVYGKNGQH